MDITLLKALFEASPWAALLAWTLWRFDQFNNRIVEESRAREERLLADARAREEKLSACMEKFAENQSILATEVARIREDVDDIKEELQKPDT
ncbi:MAG: hypothetical protein ACM3MK_05560 [Chitinophagales bacterium]